MRVAVAIVVCFGAFVSSSFGQEPRLGDEQKPRFDIPPIANLYKQTSPKATLEATVKALEKGRYDYVVAHLLEESFVENRIVTRAKELTPEVDKELQAKREAQQRNPERVTREEKLSANPKSFDISVELEARDRAFKLVVAEVKDKFSDDPETLKTLQKMLREGEFTENGDTAKAALRNLKDKSVHFKKANGRWTIENKTSEK